MAVAKEFPSLPQEGGATGTLYVCLMQCTFPGHQVKDTYQVISDKTSGLPANNTFPEKRSSLKKNIFR